MSIFSRAHIELPTTNEPVEDNIEWQTIPEFPNYQINRLGEVRNAKTSRQLKPYVTSSGVAVVVMRRDKKTHSRSAMKLAREIFEL